jgi:hypothetical protein
MDKAGRYLASLSATRWASAWEQHLLAQVAVPELAELQDLRSSLRIRDDVANHLPSGQISPQPAGRPKGSAPPAIGSTPSQEDAGWQGRKEPRPTVGSAVVE